MSGQSTPQPTTSGSVTTVREGLADPEVVKRLAVYVRAALGRVRQREAAVEEVLSEVSTRALTAERRYDSGRGSVLNWLVGIAWKVLRERPNGSITTMSLDPSATLVDQGPTVPETVANRLDAVEFLDRLPPDVQPLFVLVSQGWTAAEIGAELGLTEANVRVRLHRARGLACKLLKIEPTGEAGHD